jgi:hypothetical protein
MRLNCVLFTGLLLSVFSVSAQESQRGTYFPNFPISQFPNFPISQFPNTKVPGPAEMLVHEVYMTVQQDGLLLEYTPAHNPWNSRPL